MNKKMITRLAKQSDLNRIVAIYNQTIASRMVTADTEEQSVASKQVWFESHTEKRPLYVMERDGEVIAWLSYKSFYGRPAYNGAVEIAIYVDENTRGQKLGQQFLDFALSLAPKLNINNYLAFIFSHNIPSIKLFEKNGFTKWGELPDIAVMDNNLYSLTILGKKVE
jgi:phosphinothricin acetyltransferase